MMIYYPELRNMTHSVSFAFFFVFFVCLLSNELTFIFLFNPPLKLETNS